MQRNHMTRVIEFFAENKEHKEISSEQLPLEIYYLKDAVIKDREDILIAPLEEAIKKEEKVTIGYIAQEDGHLFFQADENLAETLYHNDEIIKKSIWLKSGDIIQTHKKIINYLVSGDKIQILVSKKPETIVFTPPEKKQIIINSQQSRQNTIHVSPITKEKKKEKKKIVHKIMILVLLILSLLAVFVLFAETAIITITPQPDKINLKGLFPTIKLTQRHILIAGEYTLKAEKQDYRTINKTLLINSENKEFSYTMKENPGLIQFNIDPVVENKIYIDGVLLADSLDQNYELDKGEHSVKIINQRYKEYEQTIQVIGKNKQQKFDIKLQRNWGTLNIAAKQKELKIVIYSDTDKKKSVYENFLSAAEKIELIAGQYIIHVSKDKFKQKTEKITIKAEDDITLDAFELEPEDGILKLSSIPPESIIRIDGQYYGRTPQTLKLSPHIEHQLELSLSGYKTINKKIKLQPETVREEAINFSANTGLLFITVSPKHADLYIDGIKQKTNSGKFQLTEKKHVLRVKAKGYQTQEKKIPIGRFSKNMSFILAKNNVKISQKGNNKQTKNNKTINQKKKISYRNSIGQKMLLVKPAIFRMGSKKNEAGRSSNESEHKVHIKYSYYLSEKEISNKQYRQYKNSHNSGSSGSKTLNTDNQPVVNVTWQDAAQFANWLSKQEGLEPYYEVQNNKLTAVNNSKINTGYRLPFEAEWVLAARGTKQKKYPWAGKYPPTSISGNFADSSAASNISNTLSGYNDKQSVSAPIGSYVKNAMGFYDLGGNVSEWCQDYYSPSSGLSANKTAINPTGPKKGTHKVVRDSSWRDSSIKELRLSFRSYSKKKSNDIGFRLARTVP